MASIPIPPVELRFMGKTDEQFYTDGDKLLSVVSDMAGVEPDDAILDIGSGYGRVAHALLRQAEFTGTYVGLDILRDQVMWCQEHLAPASDGRFTFHHLDIRNARYNADGRLKATDVTFTFAGEVSLVMLMSVFTHMYPDDVRHYLGEIEKVMTPGGRIVVTFFLQNDSQRESEAAGLSKYPLKYDLGGPCRYFNPDDPLHVIAYEESWIHETAVEAGLEVATVELGSWCGRKGTKLGQDTLLLRKPG